MKPELLGGVAVPKGLHDRLLLILSEDSMKSDWVRVEIAKWGTRLHSALGRRLVQSCNRCFASARSGLNCSTRRVKSRALSIWPALQKARARFMPTLLWPGSR
jgi:hypothetical protein